MDTKTFLIAFTIGIVVGAVTLQAVGMGITFASEQRETRAAMHLIERDEADG